MSAPLPILKLIIKWCTTFIVGLVILCVAAWFVWLKYAESEYEAARKDWQAVSQDIRKQKSAPKPTPDAENAATPLREIGFFANAELPGHREILLINQFYQEHFEDMGTPPNRSDWVELERQLEQPKVQAIVNAYLQASTNKHWYLPLISSSSIPPRKLPYYDRLADTAALLTVMAIHKIEQNDTLSAIEYLSASSRMSALITQDQYLPIQLIGSNIDYSLLSTLEQCAEYLPPASTRELRNLLISNQSYKKLKHSILMDHRLVISAAKNSHKEIIAQSGLDPITRIGAHISFNMVEQLGILNKAVYTRKMTRYLTALSEPYHEHMPIGDERHKLSVFHLLSNVMMDKLSQIGDIVATRQTQAHVYGLALAIIDYKHTHNSYPDTLEQLLPDHIAHIPQDTFSSKGYMYQKNNDSFLLYSIGPDLTDNGGTPSKDSFYCNKGFDIVWTGKGHPAYSN